MINATIEEIIDLSSGYRDKYRQLIFFKIIGTIKFDGKSDSVIFSTQPWFEEVINQYEQCNHKEKRNLFLDGVKEFKLPKREQIDDIGVYNYLRALSDEEYKSFADDFMFFIRCKYGTAINLSFEFIPSFPCHDQLANIGYIFNQDIT